MKRPFSKPFTLLVILLGTVLFVTGGCTTNKPFLLKKKQKDVLKVYREYVTESINDPKRAEQLIGLGEDLYLNMKRDTATLLDLVEDIISLNKEYDTTRQELEARFMAISDHQKNMREKILAARVRAEALTTPEEWEDLMKRNRTLMDLIQETPGLL
jgi:hypothetical protein